jgi:hypothetical protein
MFCPRCGQEMLPPLHSREDVPCWVELEDEGIWYVICSSCCLNRSAAWWEELAMDIDSFDEFIEEEEEE